MGEPRETVDSDSKYLELVSLLWSDIHHSRNQDWQFLVIIFTITVAATSVADLATRGIMFILGIVVSFVGIMVGLHHWEIMAKKLMLIEYCERMAHVDHITAAMNDETKNEDSEATHQSSLGYVNKLIIMTYGIVVSAFSIAILPTLPTWAGVADGVWTVIVLLLIAYVAFRYWPARMTGIRDAIAKRLPSELADASGQKQG